MSRFQAAYNNLTRYGPVSKIAKGYKLIAVLRGHDYDVNSAAFSRDGSRIVTASADKTARVWDAASDKEIAVLRGHDSVVMSPAWPFDYDRGVPSAAFSPDGSRIVTASQDNTARIWDAHPVPKMSVKDAVEWSCARLTV